MMTEEMKISRERRKALLFDYIVLLLATAFFLQVSIPALIPLVDSMKGKPAVAATAPAKVPAK